MILSWDLDSLGHAAKPSPLQHEYREACLTQGFATHPHTPIQKHITHNQAHDHHVLTYHIHYRRSEVPDFVLNGAVVERVESYNYLGFVVHATKAMTFGTSFLVAAARKAMFAMRRRCALLGIRDPAMQCKLFDTLILLILSYACEVWAVNPNVGEAAEVLHRNFLKHLLGARTCTAKKLYLQSLVDSHYRFTFGNRFCVTITE